MSRTDLEAWLPSIDAANASIRRDIGVLNIAALTAAFHALAVPRLIRNLVTGAIDQQQPGLQRPWMPRWPGLTATPLHDPQNFPWTAALRDAAGDIRAELEHVYGSFGRAHYDSDLNAHPWRTYYFFLHGCAVGDHLAACPRTREVLAQIPHNGLHVCFSALEPGGGLHPHTGPTNGSLTAHLGLLGCDHATIWVGNKTARYRDNDVLIFDDSFVHWVDNAGTRRRFTLMITFWHPELTSLERLFFRKMVQLAKGS
jgi:aspartyl/asparaginyl beta-hydroxylase (cupin superfamily)